MDLDYQLIGKRLAFYRKQLGYTQEKLARQAGLSNNYLSHIEKSKSIPSLEALMRLCQALGVTPNEMLLGAYTQNPLYLNQEITQKLETLSPSERRLIDSIIDTIISEKQRS